MAKKAGGASHRARCLAVATALSLAVAFGASCSPSPSGEAFPPPPEVSLAHIEQARWNIETRAAGAVRKVTNAERKRFRAQRPRLARLVRDVYDSLFLNPSRRKAVVRRHFSKPAARAVVSSHAGVPRNAELVRTSTRRAVIGIQPNGARRAAAVVKVRVKGQVSSRIFRVVHRATLWLERPNKLWRVIAFDVDQQPVRPEREGQQTDRREKRDGKKRSRSGGRAGGNRKR